MDFFTRQEAARRRTGWLVVLFFTALAGIIATAYLAVAMILQVAFQDPASARHAQEFSAPAFDPALLLGVTGIISLIVLGGSVLKLMQLKQGGDKVAEMLGGKRLNPASRQFHERRLLNVVEEMALASGVPVPPVYVMTGQKGINAFAAGYSIHDAVIGVTEGTMQGLKRDELQGVIAHEFSHILNGDMRLNIRLMGVLHGLLLLAIIGRVLIHSSGRARVSTNRKGGGGIALIVSLGLALMIIGYFGFFFGGLIKRAVSRQREYLADASAVQFTRDTNGLAGALKKIGGLAMGSRVENDKAEEVSHMFFADGIKRFFGAGSMFSTHPPLKKRIRLLDPQFNGDFSLITEDALYLSGRDEEKPSKKQRDAEKKSAHPDFIKANVLLGGVLAGGSAGAIMQQVGVLDALGQEAAHAMVDELPEQLREAVREPVGAQSFIFALLIGRSEKDLADAWTWVPAAFIDSVGRIMEIIPDLERAQRYMLLEMCLPVLKGLNKDQAVRFTEIMQQIIDADKEMSLFEFSLSEVVRASLRSTLETPRPKIRHTSIDPIIQEASLLLVMMAQSGNHTSTDIREAFDTGAASFGEKRDAFVFQEKDAFTLTNVKTAIARLLESTMEVRRQVLEASLLIILADDKVAAEELELFRAFAAALEIPVPMGLIAKLGANQSES